MGRHSHPALPGMTVLGARLREMRLKSGISQMKLAERLGFDPTHGYKYVLRLEKGLVPNPTLRTIAGFLEACAATWQDVADVLPLNVAAAALRPAAAATRSQPREAPAPEPVPAGPPPTAAPPPKRRDSRPLREQLRARRIEERTDHAHRFWQSVHAAEEKARGVLRSLRVISSGHPDYLAFLRSSCMAIDSLSSARPEVVDAELLRQLQAAAKRGLDRKTLERIQSICAETLRPDMPAR
jgi:transcriptional regulator with XRE-family HTH domain